MIGIEVSSQTSTAPVPFTPVPGSTFSMRGELKIYANAIVGLNQGGLTPNMPYNGNLSNNQRTFGYIDIDGDPITFSSSSIALDIHSCQEVKYAGLYWAASYFTQMQASNLRNVQYNGLPLPDNRPDFRTLKIRHSTQPGYTTITPAQTQVIYDGYRNTATNLNNAAVMDIPYVCYADVTSYMQSLGNNFTGETFTVADMRASTGFSGDNANGISGGWVLVVVFEDSREPTRFMSTNSGYVNVVPGGAPQNFTYSGFQTLLAPQPVRARYAIATMEGDRPFTRDVFQVQRPDMNWQNIFTNPLNPNNNFFDSSISNNGTNVVTRVPNSINTLGFDADIFNIPNPGNTVIGNNQTTANFNTSSGGDAYSVFFHSFQTEIISPELTVTKRVLDDNGIDITGENVDFGDQLFYELTIQNNGNEDIINATILDVLPVNVDFTLGSITTSNPGISATPSADNKQIDITIHRSLLLRNGAAHTVRFGTKVVATCADLRDACSDTISNVAKSSYTGALSGITETSEASVLGQDNCNGNIDGASNVLIKNDICFTKKQPVLICTGSVTLKAGDGFTTYKWVNANAPSEVIGTDQELVVTKEGIYIVTETGAPGCQDAQQTFDVKAFNTVENPVIDIVNNLGSNPSISGNLRTCPITGEKLPEIFLCGANTTLPIPIDFETGTTVEWQRLDPAACPSVARDPNCPTPQLDSGACEGDWVTVSTDTNSYTVSQAGEYRINATFDGNCMIPFYFNVFKNNFNPELEVIQKIFCSTKGILQVKNSSNQYEYQLVPPNGTPIGYQDSPVFKDLTEKGTYTVNVRKKNGLPTACIFQDSILLDESNVKETVEVTSPTCPDGKGEISITVDNSKINYTYTISSTTTLFTDSEGPVTVPSHTFKGLKPDTYEVKIESADGSCSETITAVVKSAEDFSAQVKLLEDLHCNPAHQPNPELNDPLHPDYDPTALPYDPAEFIAFYEVTVKGGSNNFAFNDKKDFSGNTLAPLAATTYRFRATEKGTYPVYVNDLDRGCTIFAGSVDVSAYEKLVATAAPEELKCYSEKGAIEVEITEGKGPFTYILDEGTTTEVSIGSTHNTSETFNNVDTSVSHTVTVKDRFECDLVLPTINFTVPKEITATETIQNITCNSTGGNTLGAITLTMGGGTPEAVAASYTYELTKNGSPFTPSLSPSYPTTNQVTFDGLDFGKYSIKVTDTKGCNKTFGSFEIKDAVDELDIKVTSGCSSGSPIVDIVVVNGSGVDNTGSIVGFTIEVIGDPNNPTQPLNDGAVDPVPPPTPAGLVKDHRITGANALELGKSYTFKVIDLGTNCEYQETFMLNPLDGPKVTLGELTHQQCFGKNDGAIEFAVDGYVPDPVDLQWEIFDRFGTPSDPPVLSGGPVTASGGPTTINSNVSGGLAPGEYYIRVSEVSGSRLCAGASDFFEIEKIETEISLEVKQTNKETCSPGNDATVEAVASGGTGDLEYQLEESTGGVLVGYSSDPRFGGYRLDGGLTTAGIDYVIRVRDANKCDKTATINIKPPVPLELNTIDQITLNCSDSEDGIITATASGGQGAGTYSFRLTFPDGSQSAAVLGDTSTFQWTDLKPGNYIVTVSDNLACEAIQNPVVITVPSKVEIEIAPEGVSCSTENPNTVVVTAKGGASDYEYGYSLNDGAIVWQTSDTFNGLSTGDYEFYARDKNKCKSPASSTIQVRKPDPFKATLDSSNFNIVCFGESTGSVDAVVKGGLGNYRYRVEGTDYLGNPVNLPGPGPTDTQETSFFGGLLASTDSYEYIVTSTTIPVDPLASCDEIRIPFKIVQPLPLDIEVTARAISCNGETDGSIRVSINRVPPPSGPTGGRSPYFYSLYNSAGDAVFTFIEDDADNLLGEHTFIDLPADTYRVEVEDNLGCPVDRTDILIIEPAPILATVIATTPEDCAGDMNGTATVSITGGLPPANPSDPSYFWSIDGVTYLPVSNPSSLLINKLSGGTTTLFIRDSQNNSNCQGAFNLDIEPGVNLGATLVPRLECPVYDYSDPSNVVMTSDERYFVDFDIIAESEGLGIIYTLNGINGTSNPANNSNLTGIFEVSPGSYEGVMEFQGCSQTIGTIDINEYTPLAIPVAQMTGNAQDPNEYEIIASGGRPFENDPFYTFYFTMLEDGMSIADLEQSDYTELEGNIFTIRETADYVIRVVDADGCEVISVQNLTYINIRIPNYFTPDSPNSTVEERFWYPRQISPDPSDPFFFENMEVIVFDRYGRRLAEFKGDEQGWDGHYQGVQLPSGDYWFTIILNDVDNREITGHFTLYR
ncbi:T9SS type B sorting domain-containing protein [Aquimarina sediminis]|uniref:T9SS type B sorting domain-containing protein n=1 Tax=Aquimarina sediminis TaxID=2070536 RepID=UPI0013E8D2ED|nr:T9SS type B sorting domain-containing protein [Aquimarina sediminis]